MKIVKVLVVLAVVALAAGAGFVYSGVYNMAADEPHWAVTYELLETLRERSIAARIGDIEAPADLTDVARLRRGAGNYEAMCTGCHLKPGMDDSEIRKGLYPQPPNLAQAAAHEHGTDGDSHAAARQFWIIKHGVKASGMPAWSKGGMDDETIWDMVALLQRLPALTGEDYAALVAASEGHSHAGANGGHDHGGAGENAPTAPSDHVDAPGSRPHSHGEKTKPIPQEMGEEGDHQHSH